MDIPTHLQRMQSQRPNLTNSSATFNKSTNYTYDVLPRKVPLSRLPGQRFLDGLRAMAEFRLLRTNAEVTFDSTDTETGEWTPQYYVGGGAHGKVGVWTKRNAKGEVIDETALKDVQLYGTGHYELWPNSRSLGLRRRLLAEAAMQSQLNQSDSENFVHLRDYKYFNLGVDNDRVFRSPNAVIMPSPGKERWRFYFELAPYGDLFALILKYQYWNQYLPEPFLWHVFDSLAEAAIQLRDCTWGNMPTHRNPRGPPNSTDRMVHFDIKPDNIFLSYPDHRSNHNQPGESTSGGSTKYDYPVIKLGDYGLNLWTGEDDPDNPRRTGLRGTPGYHPPEMIGYGAWWTPTRNANWTIPFSGTMIPRDRSSIYTTDSNAGERIGLLRDETPMNSGATRNFRYDEKLHVWVIGKVMYDLMTLSDGGAYWRISTVDKQQFINNGNHQLPNFSRYPFRGPGVDQEPYYSTELTDLVRDCLRPFWIERIDVAEMKSRTKVEMEKWDDKHVPGCEDVQIERMDPQRDTTEPKLVYRKNDIRDMPRGKEHFVAVENDTWASNDQIEGGVSFYQSLRREIRYDPDWPELKPEWDDQTARQIRGTNGGLGSETHHDAWLAQVKDAKIQRRYEVSHRGGLRKRPTYWGVRDVTSSGADDDDNDGGDNNDDDGQDPYALPPLTPRGSRRNRSPTPPQGSPLSPVHRLRQSPIAPPDRDQRGIAPSPSPQSHRAASPRATSSATQERAPSPPIAPPTDPGDCITDPSDSEVEIVIRTFRNGRKKSYYRPKRKDLKRFDKEYLRRRRGEKLNAKVEPWVRTKQSKFNNAVERKKLAYKRADRGYQRLLASYQRRMNLVNIDPISNPLQNSGQPNTQPANSQSTDQTARSPVTVGNTEPSALQGLQPTRLPHQAGWAEGYFQAWVGAVSGHFPRIPLHVDPADSTFIWNTTLGRYSRREQFGRLWSWRVDRDLLGGGAWEMEPASLSTVNRLVNARLDPNQNANPQHDLRPSGSSRIVSAAAPAQPASQPALPLPNLLLNPPPTSQPTSLQTPEPHPPKLGSPRNLYKIPPLPPLPSLPTRMSYQQNWSDNYFEVWTYVQAGIFPPLPPGIRPTDRTIYFHRGHGTYFRYDRRDHLMGWRRDLRRWLRVHTDKDGRPIMKGG